MEIEPFASFFILFPFMLIAEYQSCYKKTTGSKPFNANTEHPIIAINAAFLVLLSIVVSSWTGYREEDIMPLVLVCTAFSAFVRPWLNNVDELSWLKFKEMDGPVKYTWEKWILRATDVVMPLLESLERQYNLSARFNGQVAAAPESETEGVPETVTVPTTETAPETAVQEKAQQGLTKRTQTTSNLVEL